MEAAQAGRVVELSNRIQTLRQAIELIDGGGTITSMTLMRPAPEPEPEPPPPPEPEPGEDVPLAEAEEPPVAATEERGRSEMTISTEGITYPPQMLASIREQEIQMWQAAYDELAQIGVTNVPPPSAATPQPIAARVAPQSAAVRARPTPTPPPRAAAPAAPTRPAPAPRQRPAPAPPPPAPAARRPAPPPPRTPPRPGRR